MIQLIQKPGGSLKDSYLDEGFILDKKFNVGHPKKHRKRQDPHREHADGHGQDQDLRRARAGGLDGEGWRDRSLRRRRKMAAKCEKIAEARLQPLHQPPAHLQLPRASAHATRA
jgi:T-complex protein 1 subunit beta